MPDLKTISKNATDPIATIIGTAGYIASKFDLPSRMGLEVDEFAEVVFGLMAIAAAIRSIFIARAQAKQAKVDA